MNSKNRKKNKTVLIIGGAGFIGSHTADELYKNGYDIKILDNLNEKTHFGTWPTYLNDSYELIKGDVRDRKTLENALENIDYVYHLAAQMDLMPDFSTFFDTNVTSTALLYEIIVAKQLPIKKVVVASSQFVYGEGKAICYHNDCELNQTFSLKQRTNEDMQKGIWHNQCPICKKDAKCVKNKENHQDPPNQYAISKYNQELIALKIGKNYDIPSVAMRYSIVHGPRQSLKNAYSGALRIFTLQMLKDKEPTIYEDGKQMRDYVSVYDTAHANRLVLESENANYQAFNVGSGKEYSVIDLAQSIANKLKKDYEFNPTGAFRVGDIRHAVSDISKLQALGWKPQLGMKKYLDEYIDWVQDQKLDKDYLAIAEANLKKAGVVKKAKF